MERDLIEEYLNNLRSRLLTSPRKAQLILDETEDHLRESVSAGLTAGRTEAEAQQAAIASFGSVQAVVRAHAAGRHGRAVAVLAEVILATWKLASIYLLADFVIGLAWQLLGGTVIRLIWGAPTPIGLGSVRKLQVHPVVCAGCRAVPPGTSSAYGYPTSFVWLGAGAVGVALLGAFALIRRWQQRGGRVRPLLLGRYSPLAGVIIFPVLAVLLIWAWTRSDAAWDELPEVGVAVLAALCSAVGYLVALGRALLRGQRAEVLAE